MTQPKGKKRTIGSIYETAERKEMNHERPTERKETKIELPS